MNWIWSSHPRSKVHVWKEPFDGAWRTLCGKSLIATPVEMTSSSANTPMQKDICTACTHTKAYVELAD